jgi:hypothetical protein
MRKLFHYFARLRTAKLVLWCYLIWYLVMLGFYFEPRLSLWVNSLGISIVIGVALVLSVIPAGGIRALERWAVARLFMMPFCVSSFAALIKNQGFFVVFSPKATENLAAAAACAIFASITFACKGAVKADTTEGDIRK